jgi:hypothetical protein
MPTEAVIVITAITTVFVALIAVLAWADKQTRQIGRR